MPGFWEVLLIVIVVAVVFKHESLPTIGGNVGMGLRNLWDGLRGRLTKSGK